MICEICKQECKRNSNSQKHCKECGIINKIESTERWSKENKEYKQNWMKKWCENNKKHIRKYEREYTKLNPKKRKAKAKSRYIKIPKGQKCILCFMREATEKHHPNYDYPIYVWFVCLWCHRGLHTKK